MEAAESRDGGPRTPHSTPVEEGALALPQGFVSNSSLYPTLYRGTFRATHQGLQVRVRIRIRIRLRLKLRLRLS